MNIRDVGRTPNTTIGESIKDFQHVVQQGQTLKDIAGQYGVLDKDLMASNPQIKDWAEIQDKDVLNIPPKRMVAERESLNYRDSFEEVGDRDWNVKDKMLLPANPQLDGSAVEGNFEQDSQMVHAQNVEREKDLQRTKDEKLERLVISNKLNNLKC